MKELTFEGFDHRHSYHWADDYKVDFSSVEPRRFKEVDTGVRVYEGGVITVDTSTYRDPHLRRNLSRAWGLEFVNVRDCSEYKFATPEGAAVTKKSIRNTMLMVDLDHGVAVNPNGPWRTKGIYYPHWRAIPVGKNPVERVERDQRKEQELISANEEFLNLCRTTYAMLATDRSYWYSPSDVTWYLKGNAAMSDPENKLRYMYSVGAALTKGEFTRLLAEHCQKNVSHAYLRVSRR
jgi:hypothetical protein